MPFRNKNRRLRNYSIGRLFVAAFLFFGIVSVLAFLGHFVFAVPYTEVIKSIELTSQHASFTNNTPGSWHVTKSAQWIEEGKARITFDVDTVRKTANGTYTDIIMVIDNSGSMSGNKMTQVKSDASELINSVLSNTNNKIALVSFNSSATKLSGFSNSKNTLLSYINDLSATGTTNYYDGFKKAEEVLEGYNHQSNRELIMLFLTDGYPNEDTPNEVAEYRAIKQMYPYMTINGIQYEMGDEILEPIANVSDNQFIANMDSLNNVLFEASVAPYTYENFTITDYIDDAYWDVESVDDINASIGSADLDFNGSVPVVTWTMNEALISGKSAQLTIDVTLKSGLNLPEGSFLPTNKSETVTSELPETPDENVPSTLTPVLKTTLDVTYEPNLPSDCLSYGGTLPAEQSYNAFSVVQMSTNKLTCDGYNFNGWEITEGDPKIINDDYFKIIGDDVIIRATWSKVSISKAMDGEVHEEVIATLDEGQNVSAVLKQLSGQSSATFGTDNEIIVAIKSADSMSAAQQATAATISTSSSPVPIYAWFDNANSTIYIYSDADIIMGNKYSNRMFMRFKSLSDISGIANWNMHNVQSMRDMFYYDSSLTNLDALSNWDIANVRDINSMFGYASSLTQVNALSNWNTSSVTDTGSLFINASNLTNIDALSNWETSSLTSMRGMLYNTNISDISPLEEWDTSRVKDMNTVFYKTKISNIDALSNWDTSSVKDMSHMFAYTSNLTNIRGAASWDTSSVTDMSNMFNSASSLTNINGASGWNTSSVTTMGGMFYKASSLTNIDGATNWDTSSVTTMSSMFNGASSLTNINGASGWNTSSVTTMSGMFHEASSLTNIDGATNWNTSSVTSMSTMFFEASSLTNIDGASNWDTSSVTNTESMFQNASSLTNIDGASGWDTSSVTSMRYMFRIASNLSDISGASNWDTSSVTNMFGLFGSTKLTNINALANWDTSSVTTMGSMFTNGKLTNINALANWDTSSVTNMSSMFYGASSLTNINGASGWDTSSVTDMSTMFRGATSLTNIGGAGNWDTSAATTMKQMFYGDSNIASLNPIFGWNTSNVTDMTDMFNSIPSSVTRPTWYNGT